jgi:hypothetical protein
LEQIQLVLLSEHRPIQLLDAVFAMAELEFQLGDFRFHAIFRI